MKGKRPVYAASALNQCVRAYLYAHDANGNVVALVDAGTGEVAARYAYAAFGATLMSEGPLARRNPFRFSSEYADDETGLVYYNWRHYDPVHGAWLGRDPIGVDGGANLYAFCGNRPLDRVDYNGAFSIKYLAWEKTSFLGKVFTGNSFKHRNIYSERDIDWRMDMSLKKDNLIKLIFYCLLLIVCFSQISCAHAKSKKRITDTALATMKARVVELEEEIAKCTISLDSVETARLVKDKLSEIQTLFESGLIDYDINRADVLFVMGEHSPSYDDGGSLEYYYAISGTSLGVITFLFANEVNLSFVFSGMAYQ